MPEAVKVVSDVYLLDSVTASEVEPSAGWIDTITGSAVLTAATGRGLNRVMYCDPNNVIDIIPVEYTANLTIVAAAKGTR